MCGYPLRLSSEDIDSVVTLVGDDRALDLGLVGVRSDLERVLLLVQQAVALLADERQQQHVPRILVDSVAHAVASPAATSLASVSVAVALIDLPFGVPATNASNAARVKTTSSLHSTSYGLSWSAAITCTVATLRRLSQLSSSARSRTTSAFGRSVTPVSTLSAPLVEGLSSKLKLSTTCTRPSRARSDSAPRSAAAFIFFGVRWL